MYKVCAAVLLAFALLATSIAAIPGASAQTATAQDGLTVAFCTNLSLGGPRTFPFDSDGDGKADVCSLPYTRREAIARQNALERLARQYPSTFLTFVKQECRLLASQDFGDSPADLAEDVCATGTLTPSPTLENQPPQFYSGVVTGPSFCSNLSLGGPKTYPFDSNGDGIADVCSLPYTRREAIARQNALLKLAQRFVADSNIWLVEACAALRSHNAHFGDSAADLAKDICQPSTRPGGGGGGRGPGGGGGGPGGGGGGPGGGGPGGGGPGGPGTQPQQTVPGAPTGLRISAGNRTLTISWTAPANGSAAITDYDVQHRSCTYTTDLTCSNSATATWGTWTDRTGETTSDTATTATLTGLTNGTAYQIRVRAQNSVGEGPWSTGQATPSPQAPSAPAAPTLTVMNTSLDVTWSAPSDNGGAAITGYKVGRCSTSCTTDSNWTDTTLTDTGTTTILTGLTNGTAYQVRVAATNSVGTSGWSTTATATPATTPSAPAAPTLTVMNTSLDVTWSAPSDNGGAAITDYDVQYRACTATPLSCTTSPTWGDWTEWNATDNSTTTTATITGLTNDTAYQVQVRASNSAGDGTWSTSTKAVPVPQPPDAPNAPTANVWNEELKLSWSAPSINGSAITDYDVQYRACTATPLSCTTSPTWDDWTEWNATDNSTTTTATITGLTNDTAYQVQVRASNSAGDGTWSTSTKATPTAQRPSRPDAPSLTHGDTSLTVAWTAPSNNGEAITSYRVRRCDDSLDCSANSNNWRPTDITAANTSTTLTGLTNGTTYQVQVRATNRVGNGPFSPSAKEKPYTVPSAPAAPTLTVQSTALAVSWSAPSDNGGAAIAGYKVGRCSTSCNTDSNWTVTTLTGTTTTLTGLTNGTAYQVRVAATNSAGDSDWSTTATATPATTPNAPTETHAHGDEHEPGRYLVGPFRRRRGHHRLQGGTLLNQLQHGLELDRHHPHRHNHHPHRPHQRHRLPSTGSSHQQRRRQRLVHGRERHTKRQAGTAPSTICNPWSHGVGQHGVPRVNRHLDGANQPGNGHRLQRAVSKAHERQLAQSVHMDPPHP